MIKGEGIITDNNDYISVRYIPEDAEIIEVRKDLIDEWIWAINTLRQIKRLAQEVPSVET
jgi:hypothetical protein